MVRMAVHFIGNRGTKKLHSVDYRDGRCKLDQIKEENKITFVTLEEGLNYPDPQTAILTECSFCIPRYRAAIKRKK